ncbi:3-dehydroquinate synthase family protein [Streptomyces europaeiscabiei]|uniref:3-dehydroquinate synthase family protein n=1 Tax=Streptomyces europaeiscabiei TaxID=146819 RepID=UPI0029A13055|nr:3-dehydroquinate synthase family protein [Streptomyces europaeiscabiei]MDX3618495.1 3-dehydroquinate synthase [Streptomyces europaeiscabiei]WUD30020.1 3-dehydroquinate synthase [Streptomyces europaeiscabiei]WUD38122.1 3-dehydroquinate synthase [Streptomyces europaeiscabiei]
MTFSMQPDTAPTTLQATGGAPYPVVVGTGLHEHVGPLLGDSATRVALIHPPALAAAARRIAGDLERHGRQVLELVVPPGESAKDAGVLVYLWSRLAEVGFTRGDAVVAVGGGATTDLAGFLAATWQQGLRLVLVPSTLLGMVGASVSGRGSLNVPQGKNLVGALHRPAGVVCDLDLLATLPLPEYVGGLAEVVKAGLIADPALLDLIEADPRAAADPAGGRTAELVEGAVRAKSALLGTDPLAEGPREFLDYGHTLGHAVEHAEGYRIRHGHAVSIGMVYAAELAHAAGRLDAPHVLRHRTVLESLGLPTSYPRHAWERLRASLGADGTARGGRLRFVVLDAPGRPGLLQGPDPELLQAAWARVGG